MLSEQDRQANLRTARQLHEGAYKKLWDRIQTAAGDRITFFDYQLGRQLADAPWHTTAGDMVGHELNETTNLIHRWMLDLDRWNLWINVLNEYSDQQERYSIRFEFVDPLAHRCLQAPSHMKDVLIHVATNAAHQANLALLPGHKDEMPCDSLLFKALAKGKQRFLTRSEIAKQLRSVVEPWAELEQFCECVELLDEREYRNQTRDYRNRSSHRIPPHFEFGDIEIWTRSIGFRSEYIHHQDGTYTLREDKTKMSISYGFGGISSLKHEDAIQHCQSQYEIAIKAYSIYRAFLEGILRALNEAASLAK